MQPHPQRIPGSNAQAGQRFWLRAATEEDAPSILDVIHAAFAEYQGKLDPPSGAPGETEASLRSLFVSERCIVAGFDAQMAGCVFFHIGLSDTYFHRLAVLPAYRGRGVGLALTAGVEAQAVRAGSPRVRLGVRLQLPENQALYAALGYKVTGLHAHPGYDRPTYAAMVKDVSQPAVRTIEVVPYDPAWPQRYRTEAKLLALVFGADLLEIHHVGSTAVPGLAAKPIIDIMPVVRDLAVADEAAPLLALLGYQARGEHGIPGRRYFRRWERRRVSQVHVYATGHPEIRQHLVFRNYLRAHRDKAQRYGEVKAEAAQRYAHDIEGYMACKDALIRQYLDEALAWAAGEDCATRP